MRPGLKSIPNALPVCGALLVVGLWVVELLSYDGGILVGQLLASLDLPVSHFDHAWPPTATSANLLAIATGSVGAVFLFALARMNSFVKACAVACATSLTAACLTSEFGLLRFDYVLTLLAVEAMILTGLASVFISRPSTPRRWSNFSILDIVALTAIVAFGVYTLSHVPSAVVEESQIVFWVLVLGSISGILSLSFLRSFYGTTGWFIFASLALLTCAAIGATTAFMCFESLRKPNCHYDVEAGTFDGFRLGYYHWFAVHFLVQSLATFALTKAMIGLSKRKRSVSQSAINAT